ncbi:7-keto-8-aminopelargonate synthetase [Leptolinea tardivitalis]|nr:7-keto-8-aminopelargonate synthetase [Leptolinea tardivitalis]
MKNYPKMKNNHRQKDYQLESPIGSRVIINGQEVDYFSGTGYLGLQSHPDVLKAAADTLARYGLSTATSRGGFGEHPVYHWLEQEACAYFNTEKALFFPSGYMGMSVLVQTNGSGSDHIFIDSAAHYSLWDAALAANKTITPFHHVNPGHLEEIIRSEILPDEHPLVISDAVFPISGEIAPLPDYLKIIEPFNGRIFLDDAHGVGVLGENGRGILEYFNIQSDRVKTCGTLAKALGGYGGIIAGPGDWIDEMDQNSSICIGASPPPLVTAAASARALTIARENPRLRRQLWANVKQARDGLRSLGWELDDTPVPIICLPSLQGQNLASVQKQLFAQGFAVAYVRSYSSTPAGGALRVAVCAQHTSDQINRLVDTMKNLAL